MSRLESMKSLRKKIKSEGNEEEREIAKLGKNILNLLDKLDVGKRYKEGWDSFDVLKTAFKDNVKRYIGNYSSYFENILKEIEEQERQALGYHIHSD
jgi:hypothetical protein